MPRHPNPIPHHHQTVETNRDTNTKPEAWRNHTYATIATTSNDADSSTSSEEDEDEVLFDLDETAMSQLPRHLQNNMREIQTERLIRLQVDRHVDAGVDAHNQDRNDHHHQQHYKQKQHHWHQQWQSNLTTHPQTARPTVISDGGFWALTSRGRCEVAPWTQQDCPPTSEAEAGGNKLDKEKADARLMLGSESDSESASLNSVDKPDRSKHVTFQKHVPGTSVPVSGVVRVNSPHLRRPRKRDTRPTRPERYYQLGERYAAKDAEGIGHGEGEMGRRVSFMFRAVRRRVRRRLKRLRRAFWGWT